MASNTVEQIFVELLLNAKGYNKDADEAVKKNEKLEKGLGGTEKQAVKTDKSIAKFATGLGKAVKGVAGFAAVIAAVIVARVCPYSLVCGTISNLGRHIHCRCFRMRDVLFERNIICVIEQLIGREFLEP